MGNRSKGSTRSVVKQPPVGGFAGWRRRRRAMRDSKALLKEARRVLGKHLARLREPVVEEVRQAIAALDTARAEQDVEQTRTLIEKLDQLLEKHLAFARKSAFREYAESIGIAVIIALLLRAFVVEAFKIPSGSMIPTLKVGDHLFVTKFLYGLRIPWTHTKFFTRSPERGDVIVFIFPRDESKDFIKRVVAVAGDEVAVRRNTVYLNGKPLPRKKLDARCRYRDQDESGQRGEIRDCVAYEEDNGGQRYRVIQDVPSLSLDYPATRVPSGHVFVMGDNRDNSHDGRAWGFVPLENIKGKALVIWWSSGLPEGVRWGRFFELVHSFGKAKLHKAVQDGLAPSEVAPPAQPTR